MTLFNSRFLHFCSAIVLSVSASLTWADDTEIFFNVETQTSIRPNLLFILDNSGSMDGEVTMDLPAGSPYDPALDYVGSRAGVSIYYEYGGNWERVWRSKGKCSSDFLDRLDAAGSLSDEKLAYRKNKNSPWVDLNDKSGDKRWDCEADADITVDWANITARDVYSGNYLNWRDHTPLGINTTRLGLMQAVAKDLADTTTGVNVGLMAFNVNQTTEGGRVYNPVQDISVNRAAFKTAVDQLGTDTWTPLAETLFGAMRYFQGEKPFLDKNPVASTVNAAGNYISPVEFECQSNNIILMTDGEPTKEGHVATIEAEIGTTCTGNCLDEIAGYMNTSDMLPSALFPGEQTVTTYTVGLLTNQTLLANTATKGGGTYYTADNAEALSVAFQDVVRSVLETSSTFVAPGVAVNSFNRLNHFNALYYSVFEPETMPLWQGNLKRYKINNDGNIVDVNDSQAIDSTTGYFKSSAQSWWSATADGTAVTAGGARSKLPDTLTGRKVFSWLNGNDLSAGDNVIAVSNTGSVTKTLLGDSNMSDDDQEQLIRWIRGADTADISGTGVRKFISDPLHSEPKLIFYGGTEASPDTTVFFGDNQGFVHAVNGESGESHFSFMPAELLKNQKTFMVNSNTVASRLYGMDGSITSWVKNPTGAISAADGDHVYLYTGMRRGGRSYYALNATNRAAPKAMWKISGGSGDFAELGQSWSTPVKSKINIDGTVKDVLFIGGGYDTSQDDADTRSDDTMGRALYIVDALTGDRLWWAGPGGSGADLELSAMKYSMPASPKILDINNDGLADQVYIGDMGGQVWRFDMNNGNAVATLGTGGSIAEFAGSTITDARRFFHTPDLSISRYWGKRYLTLLIGSGYQAHPLNKAINDRVYMIRIPSIFGAPRDGSGDVSYTTLAESDLMDITDNIIGEGDEDEKLAAETTLASKSGWMLTLDNSGEKMLSSGLVVDGVATVTTYEPAAALSACAPSIGRSRLYTVSLRDGKPVRNYDEIGTDTELTKDDRGKDIPVSGIPPTPKLLRTENGSFICVGTNCEPVDDSNTFTQTFWREVE